jgi:hypothetical protein
MPVLAVGVVKAIKARESNGKTFRKAIVTTGDDRFEVDMSTPDEFVQGEHVILEGSACPPRFSDGDKIFKSDLKHTPESIARLLRLPAPEAVSVRAEAVHTGNGNGNKPAAAVA